MAEARILDVDFISFDLYVSGQKYFFLQHFFFSWKYQKFEKLVLKNHSKIDDFMYFSIGEWLKIAHKITGFPRLTFRNFEIFQKNKKNVLGKFINDQKLTGQNCWNPCQIDHLQANVIDGRQASNNLTMLCNQTFKIITVPRLQR